MIKTMPFQEAIYCKKKKLKMSSSHSVVVLQYGVGIPFNLVIDSHSRGRVRGRGNICVFIVMVWNAIAFPGHPCLVFVWHLIVGVRRSGLQDSILCIGSGRRSLLVGGGRCSHVRCLGVNITLKIITINGIVKSPVCLLLDLCHWGVVVVFHAISDLRNGCCRLGGCPSCRQGVIAVERIPKLARIL